MKIRPLFLTLAAGVLLLGHGALDARAGSFVALPTTYDQLLPAGNFTTVMGAETLTFSNFSFSSSSMPPGSAIAASQLNVNAFTIGNETGFSLNGTMSAPVGVLVDVSISYVVTAPAGESLTDAFLSTAGGNSGGTGSYSVDETLVNAANFAPIGSLHASSPTGASSDLINFTGVQSIIVTKDIFLNGGTNGETLSVVTQAFSSGSVPEPSSIALLGIGISGFLAFRRFFKKSFVA
jgi:hypothetical protein